MLTLNNVSKNFGKFTAVENISLNMDNGLYALLAPNGSRKDDHYKDDNNFA